MNAKELKTTLLSNCKSYVNDRLDRIKKSIEDIEHALGSETKSTAGDKHETGRAMLQLEREKTGKQLAEVQKLQEILAKIRINESSKRIHLGSAVKTSSANYFISISVGEIEVDSDRYYAVAANSPIGKLLLGKKEGEKFSFNQKEIVIREVV